MRYTLTTPTGKPLDCVAEPYEIVVNFANGIPSQAQVWTRTIASVEGVNVQPDVPARCFVLNLDQASGLSVENFARTGLNFAQALDLITWMLLRRQAIPPDAQNVSQPDIPEGVADTLANLDARISEGQSRVDLLLSQEAQLKESLLSFTNAISKATEELNTLTTSVAKAQADLTVADTQAQAALASVVLHRQTVKELEVAIRNKSDESTQHSLQAQDLGRKVEFLQAQYAQLLQDVDRLDSERARLASDATVRGSAATERADLRVQVNQDTPTS